ncbi:hypothetical protein ACH5RR_033397 [Cinchona calisaya]|uniref:Uncharacterized protein n=1 Tax=Cinchona calisaya TaxID=153742 RepID=A0ABD2YPW1_9GENT
MGTEVLRPQDFFYDRFRLSSPAFHRRRKTNSITGNGYGNPRPNNNQFSGGYRKPVSRSEKKRTQHQLQRSEHQQLLRMTRSSSAPPAPQPLKSAPPPPQQQQEELHLPLLLLPRRSSSAVELQNDHPRVTILKRGQSLDTIDASRMKRDIQRKKFMDEDCYNDDLYAGSAFFSSPSPSSLPFPSFFNVNNNHRLPRHHHHHLATNKVNSHDSATRDLRRLLRLD